jgi:RimJ/RimL family protein N-acetyltransferase
MMLQSDRLLLRPMTATDADPLLAVFTDPRVMASFGGDLFDRARMEHWVARNLAHQQEHGYGLFTIVRRADGEVIGDCGLEHMEVEGTPEVELGYDLRSDCWGQGLATEAAGLVRDHAFGYLGIERLISLIRTGNAASCRVAEKIGMRHERDLAPEGIPYRMYAIERSPNPR